MCQLTSASVPDTRGAVCPRHGHAGRVAAGAETHAEGQQNTPLWSCCVKSDGGQGWSFALVQTSPAVGLP